MEIINGPGGATLGQSRGPEQARPGPGGFEADKRRIKAGLEEVGAGGDGVRPGRRSSRILARTENWHVFWPARQFGDKQEQ
ncbi:uncharacterized protein LOC143214284 isoform X3 [Lasioglossum baleicum]|uniref:uncharacterized protein LOC143214284 isoform X3 n=1 Tax=Lasioglossum baleicum TaxID=434251 RepID=UPI003FCDFA2E